MSDKIQGPYESSLRATDPASGERWYIPGSSPYKPSSDDTNNNIFRRAVHGLLSWSDAYKSGDATIKRVYQTTSSGRDLEGEILNKNVMQSLMFSAYELEQFSTIKFSGTDPKNTLQKELRKYQEKVKEHFKRFEANDCHGAQDRLPDRTQALQSRLRKLNNNFLESLNSKLGDYSIAESNEATELQSIINAHNARVETVLTDTDQFTNSPYVKPDELVNIDPANLPANTNQATQKHLRLRTLNLAAGQNFALKYALIDKLYSRVTLAIEEAKFAASEGLLSRTGAAIFSLERRLLTQEQISQLELQKAQLSGALKALHDGINGNTADQAKGAFIDFFDTQYQTVLETCSSIAKDVTDNVVCEIKQDPTDATTYNLNLKFPVQSVNLKCSKGIPTRVRLLEQVAVQVEMLKQKITADFIAKYKAENNGQSPNPEEIKDKLSRYHFKVTLDLPLARSEHTTPGAKGQYLEMAKLLGNDIKNLIRGKFPDSNGEIALKSSPKPSQPGHSQQTFDLGEKITWKAGDSKEQILFAGQGNGAAAPQPAASAPVTTAATGSLPETLPTSTPAAIPVGQPPGLQVAGSTNGANTAQPQQQEELQISGSNTALRNS